MDQLTTEQHRQYVRLKDATQALAAAQRTFLEAMSWIELSNHLWYDKTIAIKDVVGMKMDEAVASLSRAFEKEVVTELRRLVGTVRKTAKKTRKKSKPKPPPPKPKHPRKRGK